MSTTGDELTTYRCRLRHSLWTGWQVHYFGRSQSSTNHITSLANIQKPLGDGSMGFERNGIMARLSGSGALLRTQSVDLYIPGL